MDDEKTLKEIIREELKKLSKLTWGQRFGYIWDYYKPLMAGIIGIIMLISLGVTIYHNMQLNNLIQVYMIDCNSPGINNEEISAEFGEYIGGIGANDVITIDTSIMLDDVASEYGMTGTVKMMALTAAGDIDIALMNEQTFDQYEKQDFFVDLHEILTPEQLEKWSDRLVTGKATGTVCALELTDAPLLERYNAFWGQKVYGGVVASGENMTYCSDFFEYLMTENAQYEGSGQEEAADSDIAHEESGEITAISEDESEPGEDGTRNAADESGQDAGAAAESEPGGDGTADSAGHNG